MNERFKFRIWDNNLKQFTEVDGISQDGRPFQIITCEDPIKINYLDSFCVIQQFTGLKDKNKKNIYEGDIVLDEGAYLEIIWDQEELAFREKNDVMNVFVDFVDFDDNFKTKIKVVGNIFENGDLLNV